MTADAAGLDEDPDASPTSSTSCEPPTPQLPHDLRFQPPFLEVINPVYFGSMPSSEAVQGSVRLTVSVRTRATASGVTGLERLPNSCRM